MKEVIVLRHGEKDGDNLTPQGAESCKVLAQNIGSFAFAIASPRDRTIQTAELVSGLPVKVDARAGVPGFPDSELAALDKAQRTHRLGIIGAIWQSPSLIEDARKAGLELLDLVHESMDNLGRGQRSLIVSHDGTMIALEKLLLDQPFETIDHSFGPLQGIVIDENLHCRPFIPQEPTGPDSP